MGSISRKEKSLPLLDVVDKPIVVDPDDSLNTIAKERDWPIISLR